MGKPAISAHTTSVAGMVIIPSIIVGNVFAMLARDWKDFTFTLNRLTG